MKEIKNSIANSRSNKNEIKIDEEECYFNIWGLLQDSDLYRIATTRQTGELTKELVAIKALQIQILQLNEHPYNFNEGNGN